MRSNWYFIFSISILLSCNTNKFYLNSETGIVFANNSGNIVYLIHPKSSLVCQGNVYYNDNYSQRVNYFPGVVQFEKIESDTLAGFILDGDFYGQDVILSRDTVPNIGDYKSRMNMYIPFDFSVDSFYVLNRTNNEIYGRLKSPEKGCYKLRSSNCSCQDFYSKEEYKLIKFISSDTLEINTKRFVSYSATRKIKQLINELDQNCKISESN